MSIDIKFITASIMVRGIGTFLKKNHLKDVKMSYFLFFVPSRRI